VPGGKAVAAAVKHHDSQTAAAARVNPSRAAGLVRAVAGRVVVAAEDLALSGFGFGRGEGGWPVGLELGRGWGVCDGRRTASVSADPSPPR